MPDSTRKTDEELKAILELEAKATPGPWATETIFVGSEERLFLKRGQRDSHLLGGHPNNDPDVPFVATSRNSIRDIILDLQASRERTKPVKPNKPHPDWNSICGCCGCGLRERDNFCPGCGTGIDWQLARAEAKQEQP